MNKDYFLAIHCGHNASCALMKDGSIVAAAQEERFSRIKNDVGYPKQAIEYCLRKSGANVGQISRAAFTTRHLSPILIKSKYVVNFSLRDYWDYYGEKYYARKIKGKSCLNYLRWLRDDKKFNGDNNYFGLPFLNDNILKDNLKGAELFRKACVETLSGHLDVNPRIIEFLDHHTCHAYYAYFASPFRKKDCVIITLDGWGDGRNQTIWIAQQDKLRLAAESDQNDIGHIYKLATLILGMRPDEHEYKVMGLAPYAKKTYVSHSYDVIKNISKVQRLRILEKERPKDLFAFLVDVWKGHRFDNISAAVQLNTEVLVKQLVTNICHATGIKRLVISGGIALNVKMNKAVADLACVSELFVPASGGDESLSIGGCYYLNAKNKNNLPLNNMYLGFDINDELNSFNSGLISRDYHVRKKATNQAVAQLLAKGDIVAVARGRAEFGARALGNRSILADPSKPDTVKKINEAIKSRDFWMPFALSILEGDTGGYIHNPKRLKSPFMTMAFDTLPEFYNKIRAGTHPYDRTVRPQFVSRKDAPDFYELIREFYKLKGTPALLNTSFNLHGEPIVNNLSDCLRTFRFSDLDHLLVGETLISKRQKKNV